MAGNITLNSDQVRQIASEIDALNKQLEEQLERSKTIINNLGSTWTGEASNMTRESYNSFANKYFKNYKDIIDQYVQFLRVTVAQGGEELETQQTQLGSRFE